MNANKTALRVSLNRKRLCVASVGGDGGVTLVVNHLCYRETPDTHMRVGGLVRSTGEFVTWGS